LFDRCGIWYNIEWRTDTIDAQCGCGCGDDVGSHIVMIRHASSIVVLTHRRQIYDGKY